jgi:hypothetical protein
MAQQIYLSPRDTQEWPWHIRHEVIRAVDELKIARGEQFSLIDIRALTHSILYLQKWKEFMDL